MRIFFTINLILIFSQVVLSQSQISGLVYGADNYSSIFGAHLRNINTNTQSISTKEGKFKIEASIGDTLIISHISYQSKLVVVKQLSFQNIELDEEVTQLDEIKVYNLPNDEFAFKRKILKTEVKTDEKFIPYGVTPAKPMGEIPKQFEKESGLEFGADEDFNPSFTLPLSYFRKRFDKKYQSKMEYYELKATSDDRIIIDKKYNKELIHKLTALEGEDLMDFMSYLNLNNEYILEASDYEITLLIINSFKEYKLEKFKD